MERISGLLFNIGFLFLIMYITNDGKKMFTGGYINITRHTLLCIFTFGIWPLVWIYRTTVFLNKLSDTNDESPAAQLLLCIFIPFYHVYWLYSYGQRIDIFSKSKNGTHSDIAKLCLVLGIFIPIVALIIMQDKINILANHSEQKAIPREHTYPEEAIKADSFYYMEEIRKLKEMLDDGILTQEEFEAKKKNILDI